jgi:hypothetical protein
MSCVRSADFQPSVITLTITKKETNIFLYLSNEKESGIPPLRAHEHGKTHFGRGHFAQIAGLVFLHGSNTPVETQQPEVVGTQSHRPVFQIVSICVVFRLNTR